MAGLLSVEGLHAGYGEVPVLSDVSLQIAEGEFVSVIGANGAGKTTLLLAISGHLRPTGGSIRFDGQELSGQPAHRTVPRGIVMVPEGGRLFPFMTVLENLQLGAYGATARPRLRESLEEVMSLFPILAERSGQLAGRLSGGERQMCAIARALMGQPRLLMLDEPSLGLAPIMVEHVFGLIRSLVQSRRLTILLVEQNVGDALEMCDRAYILEHGRIVRTGPGRDLLHDPSVQRAYLGI